MTARIMLVTGGLGELGRATVAAAETDGWSVAVIDHARDGGVVEHGRLVLGGVDLTDERQSCEAVAAVAARFGRVDALVNIAGGFAWETLADGEPSMWRRMYDLNVITAVNTIRAALPHLRVAKGAIVNIGANAAQAASAGMGAYAAGKSAVHRLTESLASEEREAGVRVNAILPTIIDTEANRRSMPQADRADWVPPSAIADVIMFLVSGKASAINGALIAASWGPETAPQE